ncbi:hypothetical protein VR41_13980 [Streptomyces sp. NRRL B-1568]|nr:hypothetical protein VR41_13980 [Streptomyces sp. NRRL B-1568]
MRAAHRTTPRRLACAAALLTAVNTLAGCGHSAAGPAQHTDSPVQLCTNLVSYWADQTITGGKWAGLDWEQKGLSNAQYELYDDIVKAARAEQGRHGTAAARTLIQRQSAQRCKDTDGATYSSQNWRPPD